MIRAMISQPMGGKSEEEIVATRNRAIAYLESRGYEVVNTLFSDEYVYSSSDMLDRGIVHIPLLYMAKSLEAMSKCHIVYFCKGWEDARGCVIEHEVAQKYNVGIIYE